MMAVNNAGTDKNYFELLKEVLVQGSLIDDFLACVDVAAAEMRTGDILTGLQSLQELKEILNCSRSIIEGGVELNHRRFLEIMTLRKETWELRLELAHLKQDEGQAAVLQQKLDQMSEFFSQAIADLDPDGT